VAGRKLAPPPGGGIYLGQYNFDSADISTFEEAIGRKVAFWSPHCQVADATPECVQEAWSNGYFEMTGAFEASPGGDNFDGFTVDRLLRGEYDDHLAGIAAEIRAMGRPLFFSAGREPNGVLSEYMGGFGADGSESLGWALQNERGLAEFDPSAFPNAELYADLGDPAVCDGVERLIAAHRYYYDFFVRREGIDFLTFDTMGWAALPPMDPSDVIPGTYEHTLMASCMSFESFYPGDEYVDWVSINWYMIDELGVATNQDHLDNLDRLMEVVRRVAPNKPVMLTELGFPDGLNTDSAVAAEKVTVGLNHILDNHLEIGAISMWSDPPPGDDSFSFSCLVRPGTQQGNAFRQVVEDNSDRFHSCAHFTDGTRVPNCQ
jgi:hypothetical protein